FSGPFNPLPPETTISASAMVTFPDAFSTDSTFTLKSLSFNDGEKASSDAAPWASFTPNEFFERPIILISVLISVILKALLVKAVLFTLKGDVFSGRATTFDTYPAFKFTARIDDRNLLSALELSTTTFEPSFSAACFRISA